MSDDIHMMHGDHACRRALFAPRADTAEMEGIANRQHAKAERFCTLDPHLHRFMADHLAVAGIAVDLQDYAPGGGGYRACPQRIDVVYAKAAAADVDVVEVPGVCDKSILVARKNGMSDGFAGLCLGTMTKWSITSSIVELSCVHWFDAAFVRPNIFGQSSCMF